MWLGLKTTGPVNLLLANCIKLLGRVYGKSQNNMGHLIKDEIAMTGVD